MQGIIKKRQRLLVLDLLRGLFLVVIFVDHLGYAPSLLLQFATGTSGIFASAAEGFFAISGILVGYIYGPKILQKTKAATLKIWRRALQLYSLSVGFTLLYSAWAALLPEPYSRQQNWTGDIAGLIIQATTLQFHFGWADFLARYAVFMLFAPLAVWLVAKHRAWIVAVISAAVWYLWHTIPNLQLFTAWQVIFMFGIILGYYLPTLEKWVATWKASTRQIAWWGVVLIAAFSYVVVVMRWSILPFFFPSISNIVPLEWLPLLDRDSVGFGRLLIGTVWLGGLYLFVRRFESTINQLTCGTLLLLGKNSLFVYSIEAFVIFFIDVVLPAPADSNLLLNTIMGAIGMSVVYIATRYRDIFTRRGYNRTNEVT